jgi:hypothetical protein
VDGAFAAEGQGRRVLAELAGPAERFDAVQRDGRIVEEGGEDAHRVGPAGDAGDDVVWKCSPPNRPVVTGGVGIRPEMTTIRHAIDPAVCLL